MRVNYALDKSGKVVRFNDRNGLTKQVKSKIKYVLVACYSETLGEYWVRLPYAGYKNFYKHTEHRPIEFGYKYVMDYEENEDYDNMTTISNVYKRKSIGEFLNDFVEMYIDEFVFNDIFWSETWEYSHYFTGHYIKYQRKDGRIKKVKFNKFIQEEIGIFGEFFAYLENKKKEHYDVKKNKYKIINIDKKLKGDFNLIQLGVRGIPIYISMSKDFNKLKSVKIKHTLYLDDCNELHGVDYDSFNASEDLILTERRVKITNDYNSNKLLDLFAFHAYRRAFEKFGITCDNPCLRMRSRLRIHGPFKRLPICVEDGNIPKNFGFTMNEKKQIVLERKKIKLVRKEPKQEKIKLVWRDPEWNS